MSTDYSGKDINGTSFEIRGPESIAITAHEAGAVAAIIAERDIVELDKLTAVRAALHLLRCAGLAEDTPVPIDENTPPEYAIAVVNAELGMALVTAIVARDEALASLQQRGRL